jgi:exopolysaccharide biosynthesis polyprenyl glycosylphosphotransferase
MSSGGQADKRKSGKADMGTGWETDSFGDAQATVWARPRPDKRENEPRTRFTDTGPSRLKRSLVLADVAAATIGVVIAFAWQNVVKPVPGDIVAEHMLLFVASIPGFVLGALVYQIHLSRANERAVNEVANILKAVALGVGGIVLIAFATQYAQLSRLWVGLVAISMAATLLVERALARRTFAQMRRSGALVRRIAVVGTDSHALELRRTIMQRPEMGYRVVGLVGDDDPDDDHGVEVLGSRSSIFEILHEQNAVGVIISLGSMRSDELNVLVRRLTDASYHVAISSSLLDIDLARLRLQQIDGRSIIYVERVIRDGWRAYAKRTFDVVCALGLLLLASPILMLSALSIKLTSRGPVLFRQDRVGRHGAIFSILKLRTMVDDAEFRKADLATQNEADGPLFKIERDPRVTSVGRFLRRTRVDEIPQLFCVLRGSMSLVGPRPALPQELTGWDAPTAERLRVLPGVTGMWQVSRGEQTSFEEYKRLDLYYVDNWSLVRDVKICVLTVGVIVTGRGAS